MTVRKSDNVLRGDRTPGYVDRETGAAEVCISPETWDQWVKEGRLPPPAPGFPANAPRWRWEDVDRKLTGARVRDIDAFLQGASVFGTKTKKRRDAA